MVKTITKEELAALRRRLGLTQKQFCLRYHLTLPTLISWEQGNRGVRGAPAVYLRMIEKDPEAMAAMAERLGVPRRPRVRLGEAA